MARGLTGVASLPPVESMLPTAAHSSTDGSAHFSTFRMGAYFGSAPGTNTSVAARLTHIRVLQKAV